ncbi:MAG: hypothetical protein ACI8W8_004178 [Rhodothermales bacterium]|jgi:hypothetical protein
MPGQFLTAGENGTCMLSSDGISWKKVRSGKPGEVFSCSSVGGGRGVTSARFGGKNSFTASNDGNTWTDSEYNAKYSQYVRGLFYHKDQFYAVGGDGKCFVMTSPDGVTWSAPQPFSGKHMLRRFAVGGGKVVGVGDYGRRAISSDGLTWEDTPDARPVDTCIDVAFGNGVFAGGGLHGLRMSSRDGLRWEHRQIGEEGEHINAMLWDGQRFAGIGLGASYFSTDGIHWDRHPNTNAPTRAVFGHGIFVGSRYRGRLLHSSDGIIWREQTKVPTNMGTLSFGQIGMADQEHGDDTRPERP